MINPFEFDSFAHSEWLLDKTSGKSLPRASSIRAIITIVNILHSQKTNSKVLMQSVTSSLSETAAEKTTKM